MGCPSKNVVDPSKNLGNDLTVKTHISLVPTVSIWARVRLIHRQKIRTYLHDFNSAAEDKL